MAQNALALRFRRTWKSICVVTAAAMAVGVFLGLRRTALVEDLELTVYDRALVAFTKPSKQSEHIVIVAIDDRTLQNAAVRADYGEWPYARGIWAEVLGELSAAGATGLAFDAVIDEPHDDRSGDEFLKLGIDQAAIPFFLGVNRSPDAPKLPAIAAVNRLKEPGAPTPAPPSAAPTEVVSAGFFEEVAPAPAPPPEQIARTLAFPVKAERLSLPTVDSVLPPIPEVLTSSTAGFGLVLPEQDADGKLRRTRFAYSDGSNTYATFAVAVAADLLGATELRLSPSRLELGRRTLEINRQGDALIDFGGRLQDRYLMLSLADVLQGAANRRAGMATPIPDSIFKGKLVLLAGSGLGTADVKSTPYEPLTPGVIKQAATIENLVWGGFITRSSVAADLAIALVLTLFSVLLVTLARNVAVDVLWPFAVLAAGFFFTGIALTQFKLHLGFVTPAACALIGTFGGVAVNRLFANQDRERIKAMFTQYLAKEVVDQLVDQEALPRLDGENLEITAFFSDIRGFSTFSERYRDNPRQLVKILNTYLTRVSAVLLEHGACLDKYIGDAVVCIFGAPVRQEDHAIRACKAALAVNAEVERLREEFRRDGHPDVYTRIGLNTAVMFVGNIGSAQLFDYTAIGDGMNLAARLEGANKNYDSHILVGPNTWAAAKDHVEGRELDWVRVAGKTEAVAVYEILSLKGQLSEKKAKVVAHYAEALALYRACKFTEAAARLDEGLTIEPQDGPSLALKKRCEKYNANPPPLLWDGIAQLEK